MLAMGEMRCNQYGIGLCLMVTLRERKLHLLHGGRALTANLLLDPS